LLLQVTGKDFIFMVMVIVTASNWKRLIAPVMVIVTASNWKKP